MSRRAPLRNYDDGGIHRSEELAFGSSFHFLYYRYLVPPPPPKVVVRVPASALEYLLGGDG